MCVCDSNINEWKKRSKNVKESSNGKCCNIISKINNFKNLQIRDYFSFKNMLKVYIMTHYSFQCHNNNKQTCEREAGKMEEQNGYMYGKTKGDITTLLA